MCWLVQVRLFWPWVGPAVLVLLYFYEVCNSWAGGHVGRTPRHSVSEICGGGGSLVADSAVRSYLRMEGTSALGLVAACMRWTGWPYQILDVRGSRSVFERYMFDLSKIMELCRDMNHQWRAQASAYSRFLFQRLSLANSGVVICNPMISAERASKAKGQ
jgi:hypothetical protein